jgi:hypothetical protein
MKRRKERKIKEGKRRQKERSVEDRGSYEKKFEYNILLIQTMIKRSYDKKFEYDILLIQITMKRSYERA